VIGNPELDLNTQYIYSSWFKKFSYG